MKVVSNSSVLISLSSIGMLSLLRDMFPDGILIPKAVWKEVVDEGGERPGSREVVSAKWITIQDINDKGLVSLLRADLDEGEAQAITLAHEVSAEVILLDERDARHAAERLGLKLLGTVAILLWGKQVGKIESLHEQLDLLRSKGNFRISQRLYDQALKLAGE